MFKKISGYKKQQQKTTEIEWIQKELEVLNEL